MTPSVLRLTSQTGVQCATTDLETSTHVLCAKNLVLMLVSPFHGSVPMGLCLCGWYASCDGIFVYSLTFAQDDVRCSGDETDITQCSFGPNGDRVFGDNNCQHGEDVSVPCASSQLSGVVDFWRRSEFAALVSRI